MKSREIRGMTCTVQIAADRHVYSRAESERDMIDLSVFSGRNGSVLPRTGQSDQVMQSAWL